MKKSLLILSTIVLTSILGACSKDTNFNGTWVRAKGESVICRDSFTFSGSNNFTVQDSSAQGGHKYSGVYKHLDGDQYQFDYGIGNNTFKIDVNGNTMDVTLLGQDSVCKYNKAK
jgi:hypothetical protein